MKNEKFNLSKVSIPAGKRYIIDKLTRDMILDYLLTKPMKEVEMGVIALRNLVPLDIRSLIPQKRPKDTQPIVTPEIMKKTENPED